MSLRGRGVLGWLLARLDDRVVVVEGHRVGGRLGAVLAARPLSVVVSFSGLESDRVVAEAVRVGFDVAELRVDRFGSTDVVEVAAMVERFAAFPRLGTVRSVSEGGVWSGSEAERFEVFAALAPVVDAVDVELSSVDIFDEVVALAHGVGASVLASWHCFDRCPSRGELSEVVEQAVEWGADVVKVAVSVSSPEELQRVAAFAARHVGAAVAVVAMGGVGSVSRVFFGVLGSRLTFASAVGVSAPGQLEHADLVDALCRFGLR